MSTPHPRDNNEFPPCILSFVNAGSAGSVTSVGWTTVASIKVLLYGELAKGKLLVGIPKLRYKDVCERDMKSTGLNLETWEALANDGKFWRAEMRKALLAGEQHITLAAEEKRVKRKASCELSKTLREAQFVRQNCSRICKSRIGLFSHSKRCTQPTER